MSSNVGSNTANDGDEQQPNHNGMNGNSVHDDKDHDDRAIIISEDETIPVQQPPPARNGEDEEDNDDEDPDHVWLPGQVVRLTGLDIDNRSDLNGCTGTILHVPSSITPDVVPDLNAATPLTTDTTPTDNSRLTVRVHLAQFNTATVLVLPRYARYVRGEDEVRASVIWTYTRRLNTGHRGGFGAVMADAYVAAEEEEENSIREISCTPSEMHEFISRMHAVHVPTSILNQLGLHVKCYAKDVVNVDVDDDQQNVIENVIASQFSMDASNDGGGRVMKKIMGTAFFVRLNPSNGQIVSLSHDEFLRTCMFLNDLVAVFNEHPHRDGKLEWWDTVVQCFPYYEIGCKLGKDGFFGLKSMLKMEDGTLMKMPDDLEPASTFVIK